MLYLLYFTERGSVIVMWGWQKGLGIYTDCISCSPGGKVKRLRLYSVKKKASVILRRSSVLVSFTDLLVFFC